MAKIIIEYDGDEEREEGVDAINIRNFRRCLYELEDCLRKKKKYEQTPRGLGDKEREIYLRAIEDFQKEFYETLEDCEIKLI